MTTLRVGARLLLDDDGRRVEFTDLQQALLLLVADADAPGMAREHVADVLWDGDGGTTSPRRRLRQIVYAINRRAGTTLIDGDHRLVDIADGTAVIWTGEDVGSAIPPPTTAWSRHRDEIQDRARSRSRKHVASVIDSARLRDDPDTILDLVATDADPGSMWRDAVWALLRAGRVREAEARFRDLGIDDPDIVRRCSEAVARMASGDAAGPDPHARPTPLVGREEVLGEAISLLQRGDRRIMLVGPSGVGLSRALGAITAWAVTELDDLVVASTACTYSGRGVAYDTLNRLFDADIFRAAHSEVEEPWRSILARVLRVYGRAPEREIDPLEGTSATLRVLHAVSALIERALGNATLLAVLDDLHLADPGSLTVLTHLGFEGDGAVIRMLGAARTDIALDGPVAELVKGGQATLISVPPLDASASGQVLAELRPDLEAEDRRALANLCGGLPRRLEDVARIDLGEREDIGENSLDDLVRTRLADLSPAAQEVMALLSVRPDGLDAEALMAAARLGTLDLARATRRLLDLELVSDEGRLRIWSSFLRRGVRSSLPASFRRALHLRIAHALQNRTPPIAADIGRHLYQAGESTEAREWLVRGAREAADAESFPVAIELAELAVEVDPNDPELRDFLGGLLSGEGRFSEASSNLEYACKLDEDDPSSPRMIARRLKWARALAEHVFDSRLVAAHARTILTDARRTGQLDAEARAIDLLFRVGDYCLDFDLVDEALGHLEAARSREVQSPYLDWVEVRRAYIDDPDGARDAAYRFLEFSEPGSTDRLEAVARLINQGIIRGRDGDSDVQRGADMVNDLAGTGNAHLMALLVSNVGNWELERSNFELAEERLQASSGLAREFSAPLRRMIQVNRIELQLRAQNLSEAEGLLDEFSEGAKQVSPRDRMLRDSAEALLRLELGALGSARTLVEQWAHVDPDAPLSFVPILMLQARIRTWTYCERRPAAAAHLERALGRASKMGATRALDGLRQLATELRLAR